MFLQRSSEGDARECLLKDDGKADDSEAAPIDALDTPVDEGRRRVVT